MTAPTRLFSNEVLEDHAINVFSQHAWCEYDANGLAQTYDDMLGAAPGVAHRFLFNLFFCRTNNPHLHSEFRRNLIGDPALLLQSAADLHYLLEHLVVHMVDRVPKRLTDTRLFVDAIALFTDMLAAN